MIASQTQDQILELGSRWARAEVDGDTAALDDMAAPDFRLVGPLGFILDRAQWLGRYQDGALVTRSLDWDEVEVREFGDMALAIGRHAQQATFAGQPADGQFRVTHVFVRSAPSRWQIAHIQFSHLAAAPPAPTGSGRQGSAQAG